MNQEDSIPKERKFFKLRPAHYIVLGFFAVILLGSLFLALPISSKSRQWTSYGNALFTATSAVCVTGLISLPTAVHFSVFGQVVILILIQAGGLGFMTMTTLFMMLLRRKITLRDRLVIKEALGQDDNRGIVRLTRNLVLLTFGIELVGALIFLPVFVRQNGAVGVWQAVFTSVSAFCNAGFDIFGTAANPYIGLTGFASSVTVSLNTSMLIILGGLGFTVIMDIAKNKFNFRKFSMHTKIVLLVSAVLIVGGWIFFFCTEFTNAGTMKDMNAGQKILASLFQSVTARTAGFNTVDQAALTPASKLMTMLLMLVGASPGSTGGGIKTTSLALLILTVVAGIKKNDELVIARRAVNSRTAYRAVALLALALTLIMTVTMILLITQKNRVPAELFSMENILYEAFSAFGTVGLSTGLTPFLSLTGKITLMFLMFFGRVGPITVGLLFLSKTPTDIKYPECQIMIG